MWFLLQISYHAFQFGDTLSQAQTFFVTLGSTKRIGDSEYITERGHVPYPAAAFSSTSYMQSPVCHKVIMALWS